MSWFEDLVGFPEQTPDQVRAHLEIVEGSFLKSKVTGDTFQCGKLETPSLEELRARTSKLREASGNPISVTEVVGDVQELHQARENDGALFQVASQFNLLEMIGPEVTPEQGIGRYEYDQTQGPACAVACGAATIFRNYFVEVDDGQIGQTADNQIDCLRDLGAALDNRDDSLWRMSNGYALASEAGLKKVSERLCAAGDTLESMRGKLRIGVQSETGVTLGNHANANIVTQAFCSAVPVAYSDQSSELWEPLARLVLEAAYEATLHLGLLNQEQTGSSRVFLTMLGGGAFGNPTEWITSAVERAVRRFPHSGLDVRIVSYGVSSGEVSEFVSSLEADRHS
jgi:hypothetical protein